MPTAVKEQNITRNLKVERIIYFDKKSNWGVIATSPKNKNEDNTDLLNIYGNITVSGNMEGVYEGALIFVEGQIITHERYGKQISVGFVKVLVDDKSREGIVNFLTKSHIKGISTQNAKKIYEEFRENSIDIVLHSPYKLIDIKGISTKTIDKVTDSVEEYLKYEEFYKYCSKIGIEYTLQKRLLETFGEEAFEVIQNDPYRILEVSDDFSFNVIDNIYLENGGSPTGQRRLNIGLIYSLKHLALLEGSTGCSRKRLDNAFYKLLKLDSSEGYFLSTLEILKGQGKVIEDVNIVYLKEYTDTERYIADKLVNLENNNNAKNKEISEKVVDEEINNFPFVLNKEQEKAVHACLCHKVAVLTGAAGCVTGDTIVDFRVLKEINPVNNGKFWKYYNGTIKELLDLYESDEYIQLDTTSMYFDEEGGPELKSQKIDKVLYSGKKDVWKVALEDGTSIKATKNHEFYVANYYVIEEDYDFHGYKKLEELTTEDYLFVRKNEGYKPEEISIYEEGELIPVKIESIKYVGLEDTYDIMCAGDPHNFVANGIVVHNSGKSSITKALYRIYERSGYQVVLLSPTAKACRRLEECTGGVAQTVHKFLGMTKDSIEGDNFEYSPNTVIVVDEASMLDIILCKNLVANATTTTKFLFVGDNNQLPSVQVGNVLGDLIDSQKIHVSLLTDVVRQAESSNIIKYCTKINKGEVIEPCEHEDFIYEEFETAQELKDKFLPLYLEEVKNYGLNEVQVIAPYKKGEIGMDNLNLQLQMKYNKNPEIEGYEPFRIGDRVRHTKNNYRKEVYNGETGVIRKVEEDFLDDEKTLIVDYGNRDVSYNTDDINELTLSYSSTVHASQGSEYKVVFVILDDTSVNNFLHIRRLLYTAVSRGKKKVYIFTKPYLVDICIQNDTYKPRVTKLKDYLKEV